MPPSNSKPTFYTVFSNSPKAEDFLPNLSEEASKISDHLNGLAFNDIIYYMKDELFSAERLLDTFSRYGEKFTIFYFSGHAKDGSLKLSDNFVANAGKMAALINNLKNLKLAFFNACETFDLARAIVKKRLASRNPTRIELIACGREVNTFAAENFGHKFIIHAGREGTFFDAYQHARDLVSFASDQVVFREFTTLEEIEAAGADFDFAYIDIDPEKMAMPAAAPAVSAAPMAPPSVGGVSGGVAGSAPGVGAAAVPGLTGSAATVGAAAVPRSSGSATTTGRPAGSASPEATMPAATPASATSAGTGSGAASTDQADTRLAPSMLKIDKKTDDILAANYLRECIQMMTASGNLKPEEVALLNDALDKAKAVADGAAITAKVKEVWEQAAKMLPGVNPENDFRALAKVSKDSYNTALDQFYGKNENMPVVENIRLTTEQPQDASKAAAVDLSNESAKGSAKDSTKDQSKNVSKEQLKDQTKESSVEPKSESRGKKATTRQAAH